MSLQAAAARPGLKRPVAPRLVGPPDRRGNPRRRLHAVMIATLLAFALILGQLVRLQQLSDGTLAATDASRVQRAKRVPAARGTILDRDFAELAISLPRPTANLNPQVVLEPAEYAQALAPLLGDDVAELTERITTAESTGRQQIYLGRLLEPEVAEAIRELDLDGVTFVTEPDRFSTVEDEFTAAIVGGVNIDNVGDKGIEMFYDELLQGSEGRVEFERGPFGEIPGTSSSVKTAVPGNDLVLTLDSQMQWLTQKVVRDKVLETGAAWGSAVVMQTRTGEILGMASMVRDDEDGTVGPASYNRPMIDVYEPGSVAKVFTIAGALEAGIVQRDTVIEIEASRTVADVTFEEHGGAKTLTVEQILQTSSNLGTVGIAEELGKQRLYETLRSFGLGQATGPDGEPQFPGESRGILAAPDKWSGTSLATISYGHGMSTTVLQLAAGYNAIANGGEYISPTLVRATIDGEGKHQSMPERPRRRVMSEEAAATISDIMEGVVHGVGTGNAAAVPGYRVAGKTGTAKIPDLENGGYRDDAFIATFAGFAPSVNPEVTIVVVIAEPVGAYYASAVAAPLFSELAGLALRTLRIPPTETAEVVDVAE